MYEIKFYHNNDNKHISFLISGLLDNINPARKVTSHFKHDFVAKIRWLTLTAHPLAQQSTGYGHPLTCSCGL